MTESLSSIPTTKAAKEGNWNKIRTFHFPLSGMNLKGKYTSKVLPRKFLRRNRTNISGKRPYKSRIGARISPQSQPIASRMQLIRAFVKEAARWLGKEVERPDNWGGYAVTPTRMEFWQGRPNRLHDRFLYTLKTDGKWEINRLSP